MRIERDALTAGEAAEGHIEAAQVHAYRVAVDAGDYVRVRLEQRGLDLKLTVKAPDGRGVGDFQDPDIVDGPERWSLLAESGGEYALELTPGKDGAGDYAIALEERRPPADTDLARVAGEQAYLEATKLRLAERAQQLKPALVRYGEALRAFEAQGDLTMQGRCLFGLNRVSMAMGQPAQALQHAERLYAVRRQEGDQRGIGRALLAIGGAYEGMRRMSKALPYYEQALATLSAIGDQEGIAFALYDIAGIYVDTGEHERSLEYLRRALPIFQELKHPWEASALLAMGVAHERMAEHEEALRVDRQALALARQVGDRVAEAVLLNNIGELERLLGDPARAIDYYTLSHELLAAIGYPAVDAIVISNIGRAWHDLGQQDRALQFLRRSLPLSRAAADPDSEAITVWKIGEVREATGELRAALREYRRAAALFHKAEDRMREADVLRDVGDVLQLLGRPREALRAYDQALPVSRRVADRKAEAATLYSQAHARLALHDLPGAQEASEASLRVVESLRAGVLAQERRTSYLASKRDYYDLYVDVLMRRHARDPGAGYAAAALQASERGRGRGLLETLAEARVDLRAGVDAELVGREQALGRHVDAKADHLSRMLASPRPPPEAEVTAARAELDRLLADYADVRTRIRAASPRYAALTQPEPLGLERIQRDVLDEDTLLLEYALGQEHSYVWAVTPTSMVTARLPPRARIERAARRLHELVGNGYRAESAVQARLEAAALSRMILGPVAGQLGRKRLLIVAEGALQYVPFSALPAPGPAAARVEPLVARHEIVLAPSASALAVLRRDIAGRPPASRAVAVLADPVLDSGDPRVGAAAAPRPAADDDRASRDLARSADESGLSGFRRLRFTRAEADAIASLAGDAPVLEALDFEASRATVQRPELADYRIVHFATHGLLNSRHPQLSGLVLSLVGPDGQPQDGFLRLHDIFNLKLGADLVVLSACRTALGRDVRGEGLVGLTRGFWYAGAPRVVASLWDVRDQATAELMRRFYRGLLRDGLRPAAALRAAQLSMSKDPRWASPYYWAGFVLQGEWN